MRLVAALIAAALSIAPAFADPPHFEVDAAWPKPLPNEWLMGQAAGVAVDAQDHIWIIQRPGTLTDDEKAASFNPPRAKCCKPAPPVMEFDQAGNLMRAWGGPGQGYDWFESEHGITIDANGFVWLGGNGKDDGQVLKFTQDGKFVLQIGKPGAKIDSNDVTKLGRPADVEVDTVAKEAYIADGYGNHRVIVFDSETGAYKRHWGAYGKKPSDDKQPPFDPAGPPPQQFANPVHCVRIAKDGLVYVCDRQNNRIQIFHKDGSFVKEFFVEKDTRLQGSMWWLAFWPDKTQSYLINADGANNEVRVLSRETGKTLGAFGRSGRNAGQFHWVHNLAVDSHGNVYTTEVDNAKRAQRFGYVGPPIEH